MTEAGFIKHAISLATLAVVMSVYALAGEKFDTDPKHQLPKPDAKPAAVANRQCSPTA